MPSIIQQSILSQTFFSITLFVLYTVAYIYTYLNTHTHTLEEHLAIISRHKPKGWEICIGRQNAEYNLLAKSRRKRPLDGPVENWRIILKIYIKKQWVLDKCPVAHGPVTKWYREDKKHPVSFHDHFQCYKFHTTFCSTVSVLLLHRSVFFP
jgi:hypothetical protein